MKIIKPLSLCLLNRVIEEKRELRLVSSVVTFFSFQPAEKLLSEVDLWKFTAEELGEEGSFDSGMPKPRGEVLVKGSFFAPGKKPVQGGKTRVQLGKLNKELHVYGDRFWQQQGVDRWKITEPELIQELPISYKNSFGGSDYPKNPLGKGYLQNIESIDGATNYPLPNIIDPREPLLHPTNTIEPAGFSPYDLMWEQRFAKVGTYDLKWLKELFPGFAADIDHTIFNTAPVDQQFTGFLNGDEPFVCENMHPEKPLLTACLPGIFPRCFLRQVTGENKVFQEVPLQLDTVWLFPHAERGILIHRGQTKVNDDQASDVSEMLLAYENLTDSRRPLEHYREALEKRMDEERGYLYLLKDKDLIPDGEPSCYKTFIEEALADQEPSLLQKHSLEKQKRDFEKFGGTAPKEFVVEPFPDIDNLDELIDTYTQEAEDRQQEMDATFKEMTESMGLNYDQLQSEQKSKGGGRIEFNADEIIEELRHFGSYTPERAEQIYATEKHFDTVYRQYGHFAPAAHRLSREENEKMRALVCRAYANGESLAGKDLTGADLSHLDLPGIDLHEAFMECADLSHTNLRGADLRCCMLARATLIECCCDEAKMDEVNLGEADLSRASFKDCAMQKAVLAKALLNGSQFHRSNLGEVDFMECKADDAIFQGADLNNARMMEGSFKGVDFSKSNLREALILKSNLKGAKLQEADLSETVFVDSNGDETMFLGANLTNFRAAMGVSFRGADFRNSILVDANLRGGDFTGANFTQADLSGADLSETKLNMSHFYRAVAKQTMFMKADLTGAQMVSIDLFEGSLQQATLINADLRGANLFAADLLRVDFSQTQVEQANFGKTLRSNE